MSGWAWVCGVLAALCWAGAALNGVLYVTEGHLVSLAACALALACAMVATHCAVELVLMERDR